MKREICTHRIPGAAIEPTVENDGDIINISPEKIKVTVLLWLYSLSFVIRKILLFYSKVLWEFCSFVLCCCCLPPLGNCIGAAAAQRSHLYQSPKTRFRFFLFKIYIGGGALCWRWPADCPERIFFFFFLLRCARISCFSYIFPPRVRLDSPLSCRCPRVWAERPVQCNIDSFRPSSCPPPSSL